ncbi:MAG: sigma-70 family RNA polymerase sigma factor [Oscillospiraceae bacterium]|nr:sigma-70 family RNA polymerase sigma factor [Oscillospiraceae bacterium]
MTLEIFYQQHKDELIGTLARYSGDREAAADAVQDAFLKALTNKVFLSIQEKSLWSWLYTTAKNRLTDEKRKASRSVPFDDGYDEAGPAADPTDAILVRDWLHKLPSNLSHVVSLRYFGGLNATEIGRMKGLPPATVRSQLRAAISMLRKYAV